MFKTLKKALGILNLQFLCIGSSGSKENKNN